MGIPPVGTVVVVNFPYADFSRLKQRPALVVGHADFANLILCQITSQSFISSRPIRLDRLDFRTGGLQVSSYVRPDKLVTAEPHLILDTLGKLTPEKTSQILKAIRGLFEDAHGDDR